MKNLLLTSIVLFYSLSAFSQQLPLKIVNNTSSPIPVALYFYGDAPLIPSNNECDECHTFFSSNDFIILAGHTITLDTFTDFNRTSAPSPGLFPSNILLYGGNSCSSGCTGTAAGFICASANPSVPIWTQIDFTSPGGYGTKIGDQNAMGGCMPSPFWDDPNSTFSASWQVFSTEILVLFDD